MKNKQQIPFHGEWFLLLSPVFIVLHGFVHFSESIYWGDIVLLFLEYAFASVIIAGLTSFILPFRKAAFFAFSLVLFNVVFGNFYEAVLQYKPPHFYTRFSFILPVVLIFFLLLLVYLKKTKQSLNRATRFLNFLFLVFILMDVFQFCQKKWKLEKQLVKTTITHPAATPDIYLVITDGYAGKKQLREQFGFDNSAFEDSLKKGGFYIADSSFSNYSATNASMATLLNMNYVTFGEDDEIHALFTQNSVTEFLGKLNYKIINNSVFRIAGQFPRQPISYFETGTLLFTRHTFLSQLTQIVHNLLSNLKLGSELTRIKTFNEEMAALNRGRDSVTMQCLMQEIKKEESSPRFVYTHFIMPHPPYLFDQNGGYLESAASEPNRYLPYLQYANKQLLKAVNTILKESRTPPIILLLSDHGYRNDNDRVLTPLRFYNLAAIYLPGKNYQPYYKGVSNVNQFRILLNHQFGQHLPLLPDSTVY